MPPMHILLNIDLIADSTKFIVRLTAYLFGDLMAARKRLIRPEHRDPLSPAQHLMMEILESAQVAVVAIFCIGIVCVATYAIAIAVIGVFTGPETGKLAGFALSAIVGIATVYAMMTSKNIREYLGSIGKQNEIMKR